jgi:hypothetical protein
MRMAHHGSTPAAWTAVVTSLVGFTVGGVGMVIGPHWPTVFVGCALVLVGPLLGKAVASAGQGGDPPERHAGH